MIENLDKAIELVEKGRRRYWNGNNPILDRWHVEDLKHGRDEEGKIRSYWQVKWHLDQGHKVKVGYVPTSIRGVRHDLLLWR